MNYGLCINAYRLLLIISAILLPGQSSALEQPILIVDHAWTSKILELEPTDRLPSKVARQPLSLWLRIEGSAEALRKLEQRGMLPIRCHWIHYAGTRISQEGSGTMVDEIVLGVGTKELLGKLALEVQNKPGHKFDWRTWSTKNRTRYGDWEVEVVYSDAAGTPVLCQAANEEKPTPCKFAISVY